MKRLLLLTLVVIAAVQLQGQNLTIVNDSSLTWGDIDALDIYDKDVKLSNNTSGWVSTRWIRIENTLPSGWVSLVCDRNECKDYLTDTDTCSWPIGQSILWVHFQPGGNTGEGTVRVHVFDEVDSTNSAIATFYAKITPVGIETTSTTSTELTLYPNPSNSLINFAGDMSAVQAVEIYSIVGERMVRFEGVSPRTAKDVSFLEKGIYFVRFLGAQNRLLTTRQFTKL
jgi:hypothetical protein